MNMILNYKFIPGTFYVQISVPSKNINYFNFFKEDFIQQINCFLIPKNADVI